MVKYKARKPRRYESSDETSRYCAGFTAIYVADANHVTDLAQVVAAGLPCADGTPPVGFKIRSLRWTHGSPGAIFKQPLEGRLNLYCANGSELGDDVLIEMNFRGEAMTADVPVVSRMQCSLGGCYPHRE